MSRSMLRAGRTGWTGDGPCGPCSPEGGPAKSAMSTCSCRAVRAVRARSVKGNKHGAAAPGECVMGFWNDDDDDTEIEETDEFAEDEDEGDEDDESDEEEGDDDEDDAGLHERVEAAFRSERRAIRVSTDAGELREKSAGLERAILNGRMPGIAGVRARDLIELVDERLTELRSARSR